MDAFAVDSEVAVFSFLLLFFLLSYVAVFSEIRTDLIFSGFTLANSRRDCMSISSLLHVV